ncbi:MAG: DUF6080 domain-containing protein [Prevotella sp.]
MKKIYAFDFDGTITSRDTLIEFIRFVFGTPRLLWGFFLSIPWLVLMRLGLYDNGKTKQRVFSHFFKGMTLEEFNSHCSRFAKSHGFLIRPDMERLLAQLQAEEEEIVVVSASITNWVRPFFESQPIMVIGTEAEVIEGSLTGRFSTPNCYGKEKVNRLLAAYPDRDNYHLVAYGDSRGDRELLAFADHSTFLTPRNSPLPREGTGVGHSSLLTPLFKIKREERLPSFVALALFIAVNVMAVSKYFHIFTLTGKAVWKQFVWNFQVSGFDPITYTVLTIWDASYNPFRHPLLAFFLYPFHLLNEGLTALTGMNLVQVVVMIPLLFFAFYSFVFIYRICREIIGVSRIDATILAFLLFSFAYVLLTFVVPDHFGPSMFLLLMALYISGKCIQRGRQLNIVQTFLLFFFTAGTTLSNGIKIYIDALFVNGRNLFRPKYILLAIVVPCALIWGFATWENETFTLPREAKAKAKQRAEGAKEREKLFAQFRDTTSLKDSATIARVFNYKMQVMKHERWLENQKKPGNAHKGTPMDNEGFMKWTDISTPRLESTIENIFGESIQLHPRFLLCDTLRNRPVIVTYDSWLPYAIEGVIVVLFLFGCICGIRSRFFLMAATSVAFDAFIHVVLGFGLNEAYIMTAHWIFIIPIALAYLLRTLKGKLLLATRFAIVLLVFYLYAYNLTLMTDYFTGWNFM